MADANSAAQVAATALAGWRDAFAKVDPDAMAALYSDRVLFYGSLPGLYRGVDGVRAYFRDLRPMKTRSVVFSDVAATQATPDVVTLACLASFTFDDDPPVAYRFSQVLVREGGAWKVTAHHASKAG